MVAGSSTESPGGSHELHTGLRNVKKGSLSSQYLKKNRILLTKNQPSNISTAEEEKKKTVITWQTTQVTN